MDNRAMGDNSRHFGEERSKRTREQLTHDFFERWRRYTTGLTFEEKGVYAELANIVIGNGGPVPIDVAIRALNINVRKWRRIASSLEYRAAIVVSNGDVMVKALAGRLYKSGYSYIKDPIPASLRWQVFRRDEYRCVECGSLEDLTADHIVSERDGGETVLGNLQTLCRPCNSGKGAE